MWINQEILPKVLLWNKNSQRIAENNISGKMLSGGGQHFFLENSVKIFMK